MKVNKGGDDDGRLGLVAALDGPAKAELFLLAACLLYFAAKTLFLATRIGENIFPDEESWFGLAQLFSYSFWPPADSPLSYKFGLVTHIPNLYFWLMGRVLSLNFFPLADLVFLRLVNAAMGLAAVVYSWRLARLLGLGVASRVLFLVILTNTMMFTFLQAAVNYDNLVNLCAILALYQLVVFFKERRGGALLLTAIFLLLGSLVKSSFLPYSFALLLVAVVREGHCRRGLLGARRSSWGGLGWRNAWLSLLVLLLALANLHLYGGNWLRYRMLVPRTELVLPLADCLKNRLFTRNYVVEQFRNGQLGLLAAQRLALGIRNPGDRQDAWAMLEQVAMEKAGKATPRLGVFAYARQWLEVMLARTYGVAGHLVMIREGASLIPFYLLFLLAGVLGAGKAVLGRSWELAPYLLGIVALYAGILFFLINYQIYTATGLTGVALSGRYLFPVLVPFYLLLASALLDRLPLWWQWGGGGLAGVFFICSEFPWFLRQVTPEWFF